MMIKAVLTPKVQNTVVLGLFPYSSSFFIVLLVLQFWSDMHQIQECCCISLGMVCYDLMVQTHLHFPQKYFLFNI